MPIVGLVFWARRIAIPWGCCFSIIRSSTFRLKFKLKLELLTRRILMYDWRKMTPEQRREALRLRKQKGYPWHSPPHLIGRTDYYHLSAACNEHKAIIGIFPERIAEFPERILNLMQELMAIVFAWCVLPNHYHLLIKSENILLLLKELGKLHGRTS